MIGDHTKRDIDLFLLGIVCRAAASAAFFSSRQATRLPYKWQRRFIFFFAQCFKLIENRAKDVGLVIRNGSGEIGEIFRALNDCGHALETHAGIDMTLRER